MIILITAPVINLGGWLSGGVLYCNPKPSSISPHSRLYRRLSDSNTAAKEIKKIGAIKDFFVQKKYLCLEKFL